MRVHHEYVTAYRDVLAGNIRATRGRRGIGQKSLAARMRALGYDAWLHQTVGNVEKGKRRVTAEEVLGLALALGTSIGALMDPPRDERFVELPSGDRVAVGTVQRSVRLVNDLAVWWDGDTPQFAEIPPLTWPADTELPDMSAITELTDMLKARRTGQEPPR